MLPEDIKNLPMDEHGTLLPEKRKSLPPTTNDIGLSYYKDDNHKMIWKLVFWRISLLISFFVVVMLCVRGCT